MELPLCYGSVISSMVYFNSVWESVCLCACGKWWRRRNGVIVETLFWYISKRKTHREEQPINIELQWWLISTTETTCRTNWNYIAYNYKAWIAAAKLSKIFFYFCLENLMWFELYSISLTVFSVDGTEITIFAFEKNTNKMFSECC